MTCRVDRGGELARPRVPESDAAIRAPAQDRMFWGPPRATRADRGDGAGCDNVSNKDGVRYAGKPPTTSKRPGRLHKPSTARRSVAVTGISRASRGTASLFVGPGGRARRGRGAGGKMGTDEGLHALQTAAGPVRRITLELPSARPPTPGLHGGNTPSAVFLRKGENGRGTRGPTKVDGPTAMDTLAPDG